jgi:hypothetical protein
MRRRIANEKIEAEFWLFPVQPPDASHNHI